MVQSFSLIYRELHFSTYKNLTFWFELVFCLTLRVSWDYTAKVAVYFGLQMLHPFQIIVIWDRRQQVYHGWSSHHCTLQRCCARCTLLHSLALKPKKKWLVCIATADRELETRPGNSLWRALRANYIFTYVATIKGIPVSVIIEAEIPFIMQIH